ncbi:hypothetical protein AB6A40_007464 [Gnathostoma spinigerum]|uniref:18S rRNA (pseudouridine-N1)-methyltransferase n=1 Tax=Gnathostoma spinigerum TaxID=75299 RepID=A0ABD6EMI7_9BILA
MAPPSKRLKTEENEGADDGQRLIVILENCGLQLANVGKDRNVLLCSNKHNDYLKSKKMDPSKYRPDIVHQCLLMLLDSPLNRASRLQVYMHTINNILIEVNPQTRIPRTYDRFCGLMAQLLQKLTIRAEGSSVKLLKIIRNPVELYLPVGCRKLLTSFQASNFVSCRDLLPEGSNQSVAIVVGAMAKGKVG